MMKPLLLLAFLLLPQSELRTVYQIVSRLNNLTHKVDRKILTLEKRGDLLMLTTQTENYVFDITSSHPKPNEGITYTFNSGGADQGWVDIVNKRDGKHIYFHCSGNPKMDSDLLVGQIKMGY